MARKKSTFAVEDDEAEPSLQISTMCDILMSILIFFVATASKEVAQPLAEVKLPDAADAKDKEKQGETIIYIQYFGGQSSVVTEKRPAETPYKDPADPALINEIKIAKEVSIKLGTPEDAFRVLIRCDKEVPYKFVRDVMKACGKAGVINVTFATNKSGEM